MNERRPRRVADGILALLAFLAVLTAATLVAVRSYPTAAQRISVQIIAEQPWVAELGQSGWGLVVGIGRRVREGYSYRVRRPALAIAHLLDAAARPQASQVPSSTVGVWPSEFECDECHQGYWEEALFTMVYLPHELHAVRGVACSRCHVMNGAGRDAVPPMSSCSTCHQETRDARACDTCHPPGSVFHGAQLAGAPRIGRECSVCHPARRLQSSANVRVVSQLGGNEAPCTACHGRQFCAECHPPQHGGGYVSRHASMMRSHEVSPSRCWGCHAARWCAVKCHGDAGTAATATKLGRQESMLQ